MRFRYSELLAQAAQLAQGLKQTGEFYDSVASVSHQPFTTSCLLLPLSYACIQLSYMHALRKHLSCMSLQQQLRLRSLCWCVCIAGMAHCGIEGRIAVKKEVNCLAPKKISVLCCMSCSSIRHAAEAQLAFVLS